MVASVPLKFCSRNKKYIQEYGNKQKKIRSALNIQKEVVNNADNYVRDRVSKMRATRNNELAKTLGLYAIPVAATVGGVAIYKHHKKKHQSKKEKDVNQNEL